MDKFYQACYTRVGGTDRNAGWQLTNFSPETPAKLLNAFEQRQKGNEPVGRDTPRDVNRDYLCALDISCEADALSFTRIQYGVPCYGREGSYSHGFLFPNAYELLKKPELLLALSGDNFCFRGEHPDPEQALELYLQRTAQIPETLRYGEEWTVERALKRAGMKKSAYKEFVYCLYGSWAKSAKTTIFVKTDGSDEMAKALVYLAYAALPYSLRPKLAVSTFLEAKNATLILSHEQPDGCRYFDPATGTHNVLTGNQRKRWEKMPFVTMLFGEEGPQFDALERQLSEMGDRYSQDFTALQMACQMGLDSGDADPVDQLYDFLNIPQDFNEMMEQKVAQKLDDVSLIIEESGLAVSEDMENLLKQRLNMAVSDELRRAGYRYKSARLSRMSPEDGCRYLKTDPDFAVLRENLQKTEKGMEMLTEFYHLETAAVTDAPDCNYESLVHSAGKFCDLENMGDLWELVLGAAKKLASDQCHTAMLGMRTGEAGTMEHTPLKQALDRYIEFGRQLQKLSGIHRETGQGVIERYKKDLHGIIDEWLREYDKQFRRNFDPKRMAEYVLFYTKDFVMPEFMKVCDLRYGAELLKVYRDASEGNIGALMEFVDSGCAANLFASDGSGIKRRTRLTPASDEERKLIERSVFRYWADSERVQKNAWMWEIIRKYDDAPRKHMAQFCEMDTKTFRFWEMAAQYQNVNMIWLMLEKKAVQIVAERILERSMNINEHYWTDERLRTLIGNCDACVRDGKEEAKGIRETLLAEFNFRQEMRQTIGKKKKEEKPSKQEKKAEKHGKNPDNPKRKPDKHGSRQTGWDNQPGVPNKFTVDYSDDQPTYPQRKSSGHKPANHHDMDAVLDFVTPGHRQEEDVREQSYSGNEPNPLLQPEKEEKPGKRNLFDIFVNKKRRS